MIQRSTFNTMALLTCLPLMASCSGQTGSGTVQQANNASPFPPHVVTDTTQLAEYIVAAFEDSKGNLWFGTVGEGVARYDGKALTYLTTKDGLIDDVVPGIAEDKEGNLWFGTHAGASRWDGKVFTNFGSAQGLTGMGCKILVDRKGTVWAGTNDGAFRWDGDRFIPFALPVPVIDDPSHKWAKGKVWALIEDSKGNIWFGRDGYGACRYDGQTFTHFTKSDGLCSNNVAHIVEDAQGDLWFGSITSDFPPIKEGGVARYDGKTFTRFADVKGLTGNDVYMVFAERSGNVWVCPVGVGAYRYDGKAFTLFDRTERPHLIQNFGVQAVLEDSKGTLWFGFSGGLFRFDGTMFRNVTRGGLGQAGEQADRYQYTIKGSSDLSENSFAMWWKSILFWFVLMGLAIGNGTVRIKLIIPVTGLTAGLAISTVMLCGLILLATWLSIRWLGPGDAQQAWGIGLLWLAMTLGFEFGAGHFLFKKPWSELLVDYDIMQGRIWLLVPIVTAIAPWLMAKARGLFT